MLLDSRLVEEKRNVRLTMGSVHIAKVPGLVVASLGREVGFLRCAGVGGRHLGGHFNLRDRDLVGPIRSDEHGAHPTRYLDDLFLWKSLI